MPRPHRPPSPLTRIRAVLLLGAASFLAAPTAGAGTVQVDDSVRDSVDVLVASLMAEQHIPGVAVAIVENGRLVKARGYGLADVEHSVPVTAETIFQSGSIGKQFTAAAVLLLAEEGRIVLDDPITLHLEGAPDEWGNITVRHLLTHTGGLGDYESRVNLRSDYAESELLAEIAAAKRLFEPGAEWSYSNSGYVVLGILISEVTGEHWGRYVKERVFAPAHMETASVISEADIVPHRASGYVIRDGALQNQDWVSPTFQETGDGALYFSVLDLVRWDQALRSDAVLASASRTSMWTPAKLVDGSRVGYGFGWHIVSVPDRPHVAHSGGWQGFSTMILRYEEPSVTFVVLTNSAQAGVQQIAYRIAAAYRPELASPRPETVFLSDSELQDFVGTYRYPDGRVREISVLEGELMLGPDGVSPNRVQPIGGDAFIAFDRPLRLDFVRVGGRVVAAWVGPHGQPYVQRMRRLD